MKHKKSTLNHLMKTLLMEAHMVIKKVPSRVKLLDCALTCAQVYYMVD